MTIEVLELNNPSYVDEDFTIAVRTPSRPRTSLRLSVGSFSVESLHGVSSISFHDVSYEVKKHNCKRGPNRVILDSVRYVRVLSKYTMYGGSS